MVPERRVARPGASGPLGSTYGCPSRRRPPGEEKAAPLCIGLRLSYFCVERGRTLLRHDREVPRENLPLHNLRVSGMVAACPRPRKRGIRVGVLGKGITVGGIQCAPNGVAGKSRSWAQVRNGVVVSGEAEGPTTTSDRGTPLLPSSSPWI